MTPGMHRAANTAFIVFVVLLMIAMLVPACIYRGYQYIDERIGT